jgi:ribosomal protein L7/L12
MQVSANIQPVIKDYTLTLSPAEVVSLVAVLNDNINRGGNAYYFSINLRDVLKDEQDRHGEKTEQAQWFANGNGDENLRAGRKILAIKECRQDTGCGLKEAKDAADARARFLGL